VDAMLALDPIELTRKLVAADTINQPSDEEWSARHLAQILSAAGFDVKVQRFGERRFNLVATLVGEAEMAHKTDEYWRVDRLLEAVDLHRDILTDRVAQ
jgi:acetylornithine deacetylase/succinyl-diaminopimelate desuccinylase-like protein